MKIILSTQSPALDSDVDPRFGRSGYFLVVDSDTLEWQALSNPGAAALGGAGIEAAQFVTRQNCDAVVSGDFGPYAFETFKTAGLAMYLFGSCRTARQVIERYNSGQLEPLSAPSGMAGRGGRRLGRGRPSR